MSRDGKPFYFVSAMVLDKDNPVIKNKIIRVHPVQWMLNKLKKEEVCSILFWEKLEDDRKKLPYMKIIETKLLLDGRGVLGEINEKNN